MTEKNRKTNQQPRMHRIFYIYIIFLLSSSLALYPSRGNAQSGGKQSVTGKILDAATARPLRGSTISLLRKDSVVIAGTTSHEDGSFELNNHPDDALLLRISTIGYQPIFKEIPAGHKGAYYTGIIRLEPVAAQMQTVVVIGEKSAFRTEIDKKVFNVDKNLASKGGTAADALRQVPTLSIDASGNVTLRNGAPVILVDGKRTTLTLDQIPSDQIQTIEVIPNPSARYDAQGNHGIVNIVMKKNRKPGMNGSVTGVWSTLRELYGFLNANIYQNRWNFTINYMAHRHRSVSTINSTFTDLADHTSLVQQGRSVTTGPFNKIRLGADFFMDPHNTFSLSTDIGGGFHPTVGNQQAFYLDAKGNTDSTSNRHTDEADHFLFTHTQFDYTHVFAQPGEKLVTSAALETYHGPFSGAYDMQYYNKGGAATGIPYLQRYDGSATAHTLTLQSDWTKPFREGKAKLEGGLKATFHGNRSQSLFEDFDAARQQYFTNSAASYNYNYTDNTYAGYASYNDKLWNGFTYMAGLRLEQYDYTGNIPASHIQFDYHTTGFYPSLFLTQKAGENSEFHLNYSRRVNRPQWWQISPYTDYSNPQNPQVGNPHIQSENTNLGELSFNTVKGNASLNATVYIKNTLDPILTFNIPLSKDTLLSTYRNGNSMDTYGAELIVKIPLTSWWSTTTNLNGFQTAIHAGNLSQGLSNSGYSWFAKLSSEMKLVKLYTFQLTGNYNAANVIAQGKIMPSGGLDAAVKRDLMKNNAGTLILSLSDIFNTQRYRTVTSTPGSFTRDAITKPDTRVLKVNFTYTFGKEKNGERKKASPNDAIQM